MTYDKVYPQSGQSILAFDTNQEDRVASGFGDIADYVVEQGDDYVKWNSGKFEQWGSLDNPILTPNTTTSGTAQINYGTDIEVIFPRRFLPASRVYLNLELQTSATIATSQLRSVSVERFYFNNQSPFKYTSSSAASRLYWYARGVWK